MAKTTKKNGNSFSSPKPASSAKKQSSGTSSGFGSFRSSTGVENAARPESPRHSTKVESAGRPAANLTHQQIEQRAKEIWQKKGCPAGQDEKNWHEAESQLKQELGVR